MLQKMRPTERLVEVKIKVLTTGDTGDTEEITGVLDAAFRTHLCLVFL